MTDAVNTSGVTSTNRRITVPDLRLHKDFGTLLERGCFSDVTVVVDDVEFKAHKAVLAGEQKLNTQIPFTQILYPVDPWLSNPLWQSFLIALMVL